MTNMTMLLRVLLHVLAIHYLTLPSKALSVAHRADVQVSLANTSSSDPVLESLLASNAAWAVEVEQEHPGFFNESAKGQHPKARTESLSTVLLSRPSKPKF